MIEGRATSEGTARRAARTAAGAGWWRPFGATGWTASALGFGAYRVTDRDDEAAALGQALAMGVNLVDTAHNYGLGRSEALIGRVLAAELGAGRLARDEVLIVTKAGYLQGGVLEAVRDEVEAGAEYAVRPMRDDHWHTLDPRLVARLIEGSRRRLGLATVDVALLHNPEHLFVGDADGFYAQVRAAFERLEALADAGAIAAYGVSSNTLPAGAEAPARVEADRLLRAAREVAGEGHRLRVVQFPLNLVEDAGVALAARCAELGLAVLANRPLNGLVVEAGRERVVRLADPGDDAAADDFAEARRALGELEGAYRREVGPALRMPPAALPTWSQELPHAMRRLGSALDFDVFRRVQADASLQPTLGKIEARRGEAEAAGPWLEAFGAGWERLMAAARAQLARRDRLRLGPLMARAAGELPAEVAEGPWARRAAAWVATRPGVSTALVGMRRPAWVGDLAPLVSADLSGTAAVR